MKEEEIITILKDTISLFNNDTHCIVHSDNERVEAIQCLLDLYEKEKEKNIELLEKLEMKKILFVRKDHVTKEILSEIYIRKDEIKKDYISKDKIRELAKKYEYAGSGYDCTTASYEESQDIGRYIAYLELLKEE